MGGDLPPHACAICNEGDIRRKTAKHCKRCSPIYQILRNQALFRGAPEEILSKAVTTIRNMKIKRSSCGRKPKYIKSNKKEK